jgi:hypothetical protein
VRFDEREAEKARESLHATIAEIAKAKGIPVADVLRQAITLVEKALAARMPPEPPPTPAAPARHLPIGDAVVGCVAWCPACRDLASVAGGGR